MLYDCKSTLRFMHLSLALGGISFCQLFWHGFPFLWTKNVHVVTKHHASYLQCKSNKCCMKTLIWLGHVLCTIHVINEMAVQTLSQGFAVYFISYIYLISLIWLHNNINFTNISIAQALKSTCSWSSKIFCHKAFLHFLPYFSYM